MKFPVHCVIAGGRDPQHLDPRAGLTPNFLQALASPASWRLVAKDRSLVNHSLMCLSCCWQTAWNSARSSARGWESPACRCLHQQHSPKFHEPSQLTSLLTSGRFVLMRMQDRTDRLDMPGHLTLGNAVLYGMGISSNRLHEKMDLLLSRCKKAVWTCPGRLHVPRVQCKGLYLLGAARRPICWPHCIIIYIL